MNMRHIAPALLLLATIFAPDMSHAAHGGFTEQLECIVTVEDDGSSGYAPLTPQDDAYFCTIMRNSYPRWHADPLPDDSEGIPVLKLERTASEPHMHDEDEEPESWPVSLGVPPQYLLWSLYWAEWLLEKNRH